MATILNLLAAILIFHWFVSYLNIKFEYILPHSMPKNTINKNYNLKLEFQDVNNWWISPNFKLCSSHFGFLAAILNCFDCCFCVIVSNVNIHDYKHVQIKQEVKVTTLNSNFRVFLVKILLYLSPLAAIWIFGGHLGFLFGSSASGNGTSNWNTSFLIKYSKDAISKNYSLKF